LGVVRSRSLDSSLNVILTEFYHHDTVQELNLPEFEDKDIVLATRNFCIIEGTGQNDEKYSILKNYVDQGYVNLKLTCYYPTSAQYLTNTTAVIKKDSVVYINSELMITDDDNIVHIQNVSFPEYQRLNAITKNNLNAPTITQTIATRVKESTCRKKTTPTSKPYLKTNSHPKVTDLANDLLNKPLDQ
ncbi:21651_t:CDS:2, partial [Dentiscutata erythropus]